MTPEAPLPLPAFEPADARPWVIGLLALALAVIIAAGIVSGLWFLDAHDPRRPALAPRDLFPNGAGQETSVEASWAEQDRAVAQHLSGYGWADRRAGIARIPVERAMEILAARDGGGAPEGTSP